MILLSLIRVIGILLAVIASTMVIPICAAWVYGEFAVMPAFVIPAVVCGQKAGHRDGLADGQGRLRQLQQRAGMRERVPKGHQD